MQAQDVLNPASEQLGDPNNNRFTRAGLRTYLNSGVVELLNVRPEASAEYRTLSLSEGSEQAVPTDAHWFLGGVQNMGSDGSTPGKTVRNVSMQALDAFSREWMIEQGVEVDDVVYSADTPRLFFVFPGVKTGSSVHLKTRLSVVPAAVASDTDPVGVPDQYKSALVHWLLASAYHENSEYQDKQLATQHVQLFYRALGVTEKTEKRNPPAAKGDNG